MSRRRVELLRAKVVSVTRILSESDIKVTQRGSNAYCSYDEDGKPSVINIPYIKDDAPDDFLKAIEGFVDHECAHALFTEPDAYKKIIVPYIKKRKLPENFANFLNTTSNAVEDVFIEKKQAEKYKGSGSNLSSTREYYIENFFKKSIKEAKSTEELFNYSYIPMIRLLGGHSEFKCLLEHFEAEGLSDYWDRLKPFEDRIQDLKDSFDGANLSIEIFEAIFPPKDEDEESKPEPDMPDDKGGDKGDSPDESDDATDGKGESGDSSEEGSSEGSDGSSDRDEDGDDSEEPADPEEDEDPEEDDSESDGEDESKEDDSDEADVDKDGSGSEEPGEEEKDDSGMSGEDDSASKPDFEGGETKELSLGDFEERDFDGDVSTALSMSRPDSYSGDFSVWSRDFDLVDYAPNLPSDQSYLAEKLVDKSNKITGPLQKTLERIIAAKSRARKMGGKRKGRINTASLHRLKSGDDRVFYQRELKSAKDVDVSLVVDCSGSMSGNRIKVAMESAYALSSVLSRLKINNEVIGFTAEGRETDSEELHKAIRESIRAGDDPDDYSSYGPIYLPIFKAFSESLNPVTTGRMAFTGYEGRGSVCLYQNIDSESLRLCAKRLMTQKSAKKLMIVLSDGSPAYGWGTKRGKHDEMIKVVKDYLMADLGIDVIGVGIETRSVVSYYPKNCVLDDVTELPQSLMGILSEALLGDKK